MAIRWMDGFDYLKAGDMARRYDSYSWVAALVPGRFGAGFSARVNGGTYLWKSIPDFQPTLTMGFSFYWPTGGSNGLFCGFTDDQGTRVASNLLNINSGFHQTELWGGGTDTALSVRRNGVEIARTSSAITYDTWHWLEFKVTFESTGNWEVRLDERVIGSGTGNTSATGTAGANGFFIQTPGGNADSFDDWIVLDATGPAPHNDFMGTCRIETLFPTAAGAHSDFASSNSNQNWQNVAEVTPDFDASYVMASAPGSMDTYRMAATAAIGKGEAVQVVATARKAEVGLRHVAVVARSGSTDVLGQTSIPQSDYLCSWGLFVADSSGNPWTAASIAAAEFGFTVVD